MIRRPFAHSLLTSVMLTQFNVSSSCREVHRWGHWSFGIWPRAAKFQGISEICVPQTKLPPSNMSSDSMVAWAIGMFQSIDGASWKTDAGEGNTVVLRHGRWRFVHGAAGQVWIALMYNNATLYYTWSAIPWMLMSRRHKEPWHLHL